MKFTKMQGCGNDYVYVNCFEEKVENPSDLSIRVSDRHFGIGSDGLILILPSKVADCEMDIYNADGSRAKMCGNGIRCVAKYVYDHGIVPKTRMTIDTQSGIKILDLTIKNGRTKSVRVDMGPAELTASRIPVKSDTEKAIDVPIVLDGREYRFTAVSMGNPHAVVFLDDVDNLKIEEIGPKFENNPIFPERVNTEFIKVLGEDTIQMRVWERGSGETLACGTGACGAVVASIVNGKVRGDVPITVKLRGGDLKIEWDQKENHVYMTGPAATVFTGEIEV